LGPKSNLEIVGKPVVNFINILREHFSYENAFLPKLFCQSHNVTREKLRKALSYEKQALKMLMKLTPMPFSSSRT